MVKKTGFGSGSENEEPDIPEPGVPVDETSEISAAGTPGFPVASDDEWEDEVPYLGFPPLPPKVTPAPTWSRENAGYGLDRSLDPLSDASSEHLEPIVLPEPTVAMPERTAFSAEKYLESLFGRADAGADADTDVAAAPDAHAGESTDSADADAVAEVVDVAGDADVAEADVVEVAGEADVAEADVVEVADDADVAEAVEVAGVDPDPDPDPLPLLAEVPEVEQEAGLEPESVPLVPAAEPEETQEALPSLPEIPTMPAWSAPAAKEPRKKPVALIGVVVAVLLAFGGGYAVRAMTAPSAGEVQGKQHSVATAPKVVEAYLEALASADAETARRITGASSSEALLSDEMLKRSLELAPMSLVSVGEGKADGDEAEVPAKFKIGDATVDRSFRLRNTSGGWQLFDGLVSVSLPSLNGLGVQLNGAQPKTAETRVFPGTYQLALGNSAFALNSKSDVWTIATAEQASELRDVQPKLTEEASARYVELVRASLKECVAMTDLTTPCGLDVSARLKDGAVPVEGSAKRSLDSEGEAALDALVIQKDPAAAGTVFSTLNIQVKTRLEAENNGSRVSGELLYGGQLLSPHVDFTAENPAVVWQ